MYLTGETISKVITAKRLGTLLVTKGANDIDFMEGRIASAKRCICGFMSIGCRTTLINPLSGTRVYSSMSRSRMMYGLDVSDMSPNSLKCLENTHWEMAKVIQGLQQSTHNPAVLPAIGWYSIESLIGKARMDFLLRILLLEPDNVYKRVAIIRIYQYLYKHTYQSMGLVQRAMQYASKDDLLVSIINAIEPGI